MFFFFKENFERKKMSEYHRLQALVASRSETGKIDDSAQQLLLSYLSELTRVLLDQANLLARSRHSNKIEPSDIAFILGIQFNSILFFTIFFSFLILKK